MNSSFSHYHARAFEEFKGWCAEVACIPVRVSETEFLARDEFTGRKLTKKRLHAWVARRLVSSNDAPWAEMRSPEPLHFDAHVYSSVDGELLRRVPGSKEGTIEFASALQDEVAGTATYYLNAVGDRHPCLLTAYHDAWVNITNAGARVSAKRGACPIAVGYHQWFRMALMLLDDIGRSGDTSDCTISGDLKDLRLALTTELHRLTYVAWTHGLGSAHRQPMRPGGDDVRLIRRVFGDWFREGNSEIPLYRPHARPEVDYTEWIRSKPCSRVK